MFLIVLSWTRLQVGMDSDYQSQDLTAATNNFANPMYESYDMMHSPGVSSVASDDITSDHISTDSPDDVASPPDMTSSPATPHKSADVKQVSAIADSNDNVTSPTQLTPSPSAGKKKNFFSKLVASTPLAKIGKHTPLSSPADDADEETREGDNDVTATSTKEFSPTSTETDKDTQALVEEDL